jgi:uncharacterized membrane protein (DUF485 family)
MSRFSWEHPYLTTAIVSAVVVGLIVGVGSIMDRIDPAYVTVSLVVGLLVSCVYLGRVKS